MEILSTVNLLIVIFLHTAHRQGMKKWFYNKCWGSEAERQSYTQHFCRRKKE